MGVFREVIDVRALRQECGMTQEELAHALGITVGTVSRWERKRFQPSRLARMILASFREKQLEAQLK